VLTRERRAVDAAGCIFARRPDGTCAATAAAAEVTADEEVLELGGEGGAAAGARGPPAYRWGAEAAIPAAASQAALAAMAAAFPLPLPAELQVRVRLTVPSLVPPYSLHTVLLKVESYNRCRRSRRTSRPA
jgi:hypothetical protein